MAKTVKDLEKVLPHRSPILLIDKVLELDPGKRVVAVKNIADNDPVFDGHFPGNPVMPGVLIIEALAQASIILFHDPAGDKVKRNTRYFLGSVSASFKKVVTPGDRLILEAKAVRLTPTGAYVEGKASVGNDVVAEAELILIIKYEK